MAQILYRTLRLIALAPGAVGGGSNLCSPVDAGDVAAEEEARSNGQGKGEHPGGEAGRGGGGSAHVIMTVKLNESATARPACMPSRPYLQTHAQDINLAGDKRTFAGHNAHPF
jgi:hypothetical protein